MHRMEALDFPLMHVSHDISQQRWDLDAVICKPI